MEPPPPPSSSAVATPTSRPQQQPPPPPGDTPESKKRARQPRNSACAPCASLKMKCVRSMDGAPCERCLRMRVECVVAPPKPRKRRESEFFPSHAQEQYIARELEFASTTRDPNPAPSPAATPSTASSVLNVSSGPLPNRGDLHYQGSESFTALFVRGLGLDNHLSPDSALLKGIDAHRLVNACTVFRQYSANFPFVSIPMRVDGVSMASQRPVTALAVLVVTAGADLEQQERLAHAFKRSLSARVIVNGERSVDFLAGLMIFVAWHHQYMARQQIHQTLSLLSGMAADFGLYDNPPRQAINDVEIAAELDRCFVGIYFLCSQLPSVAFSKRSPMHFTENLRTCANNISRAGDLPNDRCIASLLEFATAVDDLNTVLQDGARFNTSAHHSKMQAKAAGQRLRALKRDHAPLANSLAIAASLIDTQYQLICNGDSPDPSVMIQCVCSVKEYFDDLLSRPPTFLHQVSIVDWSLVLHVAMIMFDLSKQAASVTGWEASMLPSMLQPEQTLEKLIGYMSSAPANDPLAPRHEGLVHSLHQFLRNSREWLLPRETGDGSNGRFRPVNTSNESVPLSSRQLPYQHQNKPAGRGKSGVLDPDFWSRMANER